MLVRGAPLIAGGLIVLGGADTSWPQTPPASTALAPYVATPQDVVDRMLTLASVTAKDVVYDLGSGDGRIPITAAKKFGARGVGLEIDPQRIAESNASAKAAGVDALVSFRLGVRDSGSRLSPNSRPRAESLKPI